MSRLRVVTGFALGTVALLATPAEAQQTLNLTVGVFQPTSEDARPRGDVLNENRRDLLFDIADFLGPSAGAEWLVGLGDFLEAGAGVSFTRRTVHSVYERLVDSDGSEIEQDLRLRIVPIDFTVRAVPLGQRRAVQPYVGAGLGVLWWRYAESGEFVGAQSQIFRDQFAASGSETAPVVVVGIRFADPDFSVGGEVRHRSVTAPLDNRFAGLDPKIDLGGWTWQVTIGRSF